MKYLFYFFSGSIKKFVEQMKLEIEANQRKNESLEKKKAAALEEEVGELKACVEKEIRQLKSSISILESSSHPVSISVQPVYLQV